MSMSLLLATFAAGATPHLPSGTEHVWFIDYDDRLSVDVGDIDIPLYTGPDTDTDTDGTPYRSSYDVSVYEFIATADQLGLMRKPGTCGTDAWGWGDLASNWNTVACTGPHPATSFADLIAKVDAAFGVVDTAAKDRSVGYVMPPDGVALKGMIIQLHGTSGSYCDPLDVAPVASWVNAARNAGYAVVLPEARGVYITGTPTSWAAEEVDGTCRSHDYCSTDPFPEPREFGEPGRWRSRWQWIGGYVSNGTPVVYDLDNDGFVDDASYVLEGMMAIATAQGIDVDSIPIHVVGGSNGGSFAPVLAASMEAAKATFGWDPAPLPGEAGDTDSAAFDTAWVDSDTDTDLDEYTARRVVIWMHDGGGIPLANAILADTTGYAFPTMFVYGQNDTFGWDIAEKVAPVGPFPWTAAINYREAPDASAIQALPKINGSKLFDAAGATELADYLLEDVDVIDTDGGYLVTGRWRWETWTSQFDSDIEACDTDTDVCDTAGTTCDECGCSQVGAFNRRDAMMAYELLQVADATHMLGMSVHDEILDFLDGGETVLHDGFPCAIDRLELDAESDTDPFAPSRALFDNDFKTHPYAKKSAMGGSGWEVGELTACHADPDYYTFEFPVGTPTGLKGCISVVQSDTGDSGEPELEITHYTVSGAAWSPSGTSSTGPHGGKRVEFDVIPGGTHGLLVEAATGPFSPVQSSGYTGDGTRYEFKVEPGVCPSP